MYGSVGQPDTAYFSFSDNLRTGKKIKSYNYGNCKRDFTYVEDIVEGIAKILQLPLEKVASGDGLSIPLYAIYSIGNSSPENLMDFVHKLSEELVRVEVLPSSFNIEKYIELVQMQSGM